MKTLCLTILSFLFVVAAWGQSPGNPTQINNTRYYSFKQFLGSDSAFLMPQRDTNWTPSRPAMVFRPADSTVYYWNLRYWIAFAKAVSPTNLGIYLLKANFIDSLNNNRQQLSKVGDTVYLSFGGKVNVMPDTTTKVATINFVKNQGYITTESDPVFKGSPAFGITTININNWNSAFNNATFDSVGKKLRLFAINGAQDSIIINSVLATNFNPVSHDSTIIMQGTGKVYGDTLRVMVDTTRSGIATHNWTLGQGFIKSETDPVATAKTITMVNGSGVTIFGTPTQTLGSNPTWTFKADTGLVATLAALGDSVVNKKHWDSAFVKVKFDTSSRVLTMYDFKNDSALVVIPKGGTQNGMVAINTIRYGDILKIYADNGASTEITINNQDSLTRAHFSDTLTYLYPLKSNPSKYIPLTALSALVPLSYVNTTGVFSIDTSGAANGVATINYVQRQGYVKTETDPVATAKTVTITAGTGITVTGASQTVGSNPAFTVAAQNTTAIWNANQLQGTPVSTTPPSINQLLQYNGTNWIGFTPTYAPGFTVTVPITYSSNVIGLDTTTAAHGMASINYVQRQGYLTSNQSITVTASGDATGTGSGNTAISLPLTLANSGVGAGGFTRGIVNAKGLITSATDTAYQVAGSYALTNGSNATGTWPIGITGSASSLSAILSSTLGGSGVNNAGTLTWGAGGTLGSNAYTSTAYLPLTGGTLTGVLNGTTASFSGVVSANKLIIAVPAGPSNGIIITGNITSNTSADIIINRSGSSLYTVGNAPNIQLTNTTDNTNVLIQETSGAIQFFNNTPTQGWKERLRIDSLGQVTDYGLLSATSILSSGQGRFGGWYTSGSGPAAEVGVSGNALFIGYDRTALKYLPVELDGGTTNTNFNSLIINNTGFSFRDKNLVTQTTIDSIGDITAHQLVINIAPTAVGLTINGSTTANTTSEILITRTGVPSYGIGNAATIELGNKTDNTFVVIQQNSGALQFFNNTLTQGWKERLRIDTLGNIQALNSGYFTSTKFITIGGTSSQFVKGDGSLDGTAYTPTNGTGATGTWGISITGNSATSGQVNNSITFNNSGSGAASGTTFNGSAAQTISYNTIGAAPVSGSGNYIQNTNVQQATSNFNISGTGDVGSVFTSHGGSVIVNAGTYVYQTWEQTNTSSWVFRVANADSIFRLVRFNSNGAQSDLYDWNYNGNYTNAGTITASGFYNSSDTTLKNIYFWNPSRDGIESIIYSWKSDPENKVHWGYAAQQVQKVLPNAVITGTDNKLKVDYNEVHTYKIAALEEENKQLTEKVDSLETKLDTLQKEVELIKEEIKK